MTLYWTDKSTGEMQPVLAGLKTPSRFKVTRLTSPRVGQRRTPRHPHSRKESPLEHLAICLVGIFAALAALSVPLLT